MAVERKISKRKYILAGILTFLIFSLGLALGMILDNERFRWIERVNNEQEVDYQSLQLQYLYLGYLEETDESCAAVSVALEKTITDLSESLGRFLEYKEQSAIGKDPRVIERGYLLDNIKYWLFAQKTKKTCDLDQVSILYFFSDDCKSCPDQGVILSYFKKKFEEKLLVFPINVGLEQDEPIITMLKRQFGVEELPSIVIDDKTHSGVVSKNKLAKLICSSFKEDLYECSYLVELDDNETETVS